MSNNNTFGNNQFVIIPPFDHSKPEGRPKVRTRLVLVKPLVMPKPELNELNSNVTSEPSAQVKDVDNIIWFD